MVLRYLNEEVVNFDGKPEVYEVVEGNIIPWTLSHIIRTLMKNLAVDDNYDFPKRVLASNIGVKLRDTTADSVEITESEFALIKEAGEKSCHPVLLELFNKGLDSCNAD